MIKIYAENNEIFGPIAYDIKGLQKGAETLLKKVNNALVFDYDNDLLTIDHSLLSIPNSLRKRINLVQSIGV